MATAKDSITDPVDLFSSDDRQIISSALRLSLASAQRAAKSAKSEGVRAAYVADAMRIENLLARFR